MTNPLVPDVDTLGNLRPIQKVVFSLGSNRGDSLEHLQGAVNLLADTPDLIPVDISGVYRTKPVGSVIDQPDFLNLIMVAETVMEPLTMLERCLAVEQAHQRERIVPGGPRTLDVDLIMVGHRVVNTDALTLPHPRAHERAFVLVPWLEADPLGELEGAGKLADLVAALDTRGVVRTDDLITLP
ncbi:2-amino-4-hydroxy-6-hydroxymethyldihydropteridine diphosphokinase [Luteococcus sanguinis]|uniref:2-amino-4-hydroxy-6-hydroxymethyldihydropteridine diphosphokinase n=1 Tax=Luteococcus sanguinis TaxID=174038 RepID=A0ABW1WYX4_9ACTN